jgi:hypothetical protein
LFYQRAGTAIWWIRNRDRKGIARRESSLTADWQEANKKVFKKYSQMKLQMKREALEKLNRRANEMAPVVADALMAGPMCTVTVQ